MNAAPPRLIWPEGKSFAFTIFDDPDGQVLKDGREIYSLLADLGFRTTKGVWPSGPLRERNSKGDTCADPEYRDEALRLQERGFEIGYHNNAPHSSTREEVIAGLDAFRQYFGRDPVTMANHYNRDAMYWGPARLTGVYRSLYQLMTRGDKLGLFTGHVEGDESFWGDVCRSRIVYCRNFVFHEINTLRACPIMPYYDPQRPFVNQWYASSEGANCASFNAMLTEAAQDSLEAEGGACIMYTHFGHGFTDDGRINERSRTLIERLSRKNGWFVPVSTLLDYLRSSRKSDHVVTSRERSRLESKWLWAKARLGTS